MCYQMEPVAPRNLTVPTPKKPSACCWRGLVKKCDGDLTVDKHRHSGEKGKAAPLPPQAAEEI